jgi:hypothetical protein
MNVKVRPDKEVPSEERHGYKGEIANILPLSESRSDKLKKDSENWNNRPQRELKP